MFITLYAVRVFDSSAVVCYSSTVESRQGKKSVLYIIWFLQSFLLLLIFYLYETNSCDFSSGQFDKATLWRPSMAARETPKAIQAVQIVEFHVFIIGQKITKAFHAAPLL